MSESTYFNDIAKANERQALATYLLALARLQATGKTYVNHEIQDVMERLEIEFNL